MLPGTLLTGVLVWRAFANNRAATERRLLDSARVDAAALDREFATTESTLQTLSASPALDRDGPRGLLSGGASHSIHAPWVVILGPCRRRPTVNRG